MMKHFTHLDGKKPLEDLSHAKLVVIARNIPKKSFAETIEIPLMNKAKLCLFIRGKGAVPPENK